MRTWDEQLAIRPADEQRVEALAAKMRQEVCAARLRAVRAEQAVTQVALAKRLGVSQNRISQIEHGDIDRTRVETLRRYVEGLGGTLSVEASFGDTRYVIG
jgi:transcriptional regulator with XRE-family HTH domain